MPIRVATATAKGALQAREELHDLRIELEQVRLSTTEKIDAVQADRDAIAEARLGLMACLAHKEKRLIAVEAEAREKIAQAVSEAEERVMASEAASQKHQEEAAAAAQEASVLRLELASLTEEHAKREIALSSSCAHCDASLKEAEAARAAAAEAQRTVDELRLLAERSTELSNKLEERKAAVKAGDIRSQQLEKVLEKTRLDARRAVEALKEQDRVTLALENDLSKTEARLREAIAKEKEAISKANTLDERTSFLEGALLQVRADVESKEWRIEDLCAQVADLKGAALEAQSETTSWRCKAEEAARRLDELAEQRTTDIEDGLRTLHAMEEEVSALKSAARRKDLEVRALRNELLTAQNGDAPANLSLLDDITKLHEKIAQLESALSKHREESGVNAASTAADAALIQHLEERLVESENQVAAAHAGRAAVLTECHNLRAALQVASAEVERSKCCAEKAQQDRDEAAAVSASAVTTLQREKQELREALEEAREIMSLMKTPEDVDAALANQQALLREANLSVLDQLKESLHAEIRNAEAMKSDLAAKLTATNEKWNSVSEEVKTLRKELEEKGAEARRLADERAALLCVVGELQTALETHENRHADARVKLQGKFEEQKRELEDARSKIRATEAFIEKLAAVKMRESRVFDEGDATSFGVGVENENPIVKTQMIGAKKDIAAVQSRGGRPLGKVDANSGARQNLFF